MEILWYITLFLNSIFFIYETLHSERAMNLNRFEQWIFICVSTNTPFKMYWKMALVIGIQKKKVCLLITIQKAPPKPSLDIFFRIYNAEVDNNVWPKITLLWIFWVEGKPNNTVFYITTWLFKTNFQLSMRKSCNCHIIRD